VSTDALNVRISMNAVNMPTLEASLSFVLIGTDGDGDIVTSDPLNVEISLHPVNLPTLQASVDESWLSANAAVGQNYDGTNPGGGSLVQSFDLKEFTMATGAGESAAHWIQTGTSGVWTLQGAYG
jgi:hypothetical protein